MKLRYKVTGGIFSFLGIALSVLALVISHTTACGPAPAVGDTDDLMKAVIYRCYGPPEVLEVTSIKKPVPTDDEVLVKIRAASVNPLDWHYMRGEPYLMRLVSGLGTPEERRLGVDFAGTIEAVGNSVTRFKPGDEVFGGRTGAFAEYVTIREHRALTLKPDNISFEQAASVAIAGVTALQALRDSGQLKAGQKVLINGASGGVGTFAVQIAKSMGAEVTGVCSARNTDMVRSIGADHVIDYRQADYTKGDQRYDLIIDNVGNHSLSANRGVLTPKGILVMVGGPKGNWIAPLKNYFKALMMSPFIDQQLVSILSVLNQEDLGILAQQMESGQLTPVLDKSFALSEVPAAIEYSEAGHARGKIIINVNVN